jgi:hypothetical protein
MGLMNDGCIFIFLGPGSDDMVGKGNLGAVSCYIVIIIICWGLGWVAGGWEKEAGGRKSVRGGLVAASSSMERRRRRRVGW